MGFVSWRCSNPDIRSQLCACKHQRVRDVVAVADVRDLQAGDAPLHLQHRQIVRHGLAGMAEIGEAVDDLNARVPSHLLHNFVAKVRIMMPWTMRSRFLATSNTDSR